MKIVIAGAGSVGRSVALELLDHGHDVTLIDKKPDQLRVASVADAEWILADACSPEALSEAGVRDADVVLAATGDDKANLVISLLAKTEFAVPRVVARHVCDDRDAPFGYRHHIFQRALAVVYALVNTFAG